MENNLDLVLQHNNPEGPDHHLVRMMIMYDIFGFEVEENEDGVVERQPFELNNLNLTPNKFKTNFRFLLEDLPRLLHSLQVPLEIITQSGHKASGMEALCVLLKRLAYPNRLADLQNFFGRSASALSEIFNFMNSFIAENFGHLLRDLNNLQWLNQDRFQQYADAVSNKGAAVPNCWGFIDGTARPICRPSRDQENYYSGHKRFHCVKYQSVVTPDGLTVSCMGAFEGRRHDAGIFRDSNLYNQLERKARFPDGSSFVLYGDQAYGIRELLLCPFPGQGLNNEHRHFNNSMVTVREAVEWSFSKVVSDFAFIDFKKNQKLLLQDIESMYKTATILTNCHSSLYGNQTAHFFNLEPVALEQYLS